MPRSVLCTLFTLLVAPAHLKSHSDIHSLCSDSMAMLHIFQVLILYRLICSFSPQNTPRASEICVFAVFVCCLTNDTEFMLFAYQNQSLAVSMNNKCFFSLIWHRISIAIPFELLVRFQYPIPIGNNRFYRKWFEEPSTRSISTRHTEYWTDRKIKRVIDLPFPLFVHHSIHIQPIRSAQPNQTNVIELFTDRRLLVDASTKSLSALSHSRTFSEAQSTKAHIHIIIIIINANENQY